jgi:hypothetical protein
MDVSAPKTTALRLIAILLAGAAAIAPLSWDLDSAQASGGAVRHCKPFVVSRYHDDYGIHGFWARDVKRSSDLRCSMARKLIKAAYSTGPLKIIRTVYEGGSGRPTYWLENGWRCGNGAGGASCYNAERPAFNVIEFDDIALAVTAATG